MDIAKLLYLADTFSILNTILGIIAISFLIFGAIIFLNTFGDFPLIRYIFYTESGIKFIKKYKFVFIFITFIWIIIPSKNLMYTSIALNSNLEQKENLTSLQQKALKNIETFLDLQISEKEKDNAE